MYMLYACTCTYIYNVHVYTCSYTGETLSYYIRTLYNQTMRSQGMRIIEHRLLIHCINGITIYMYMYITLCIIYMYITLYTCTCTLHCV